MAENAVELALWLGRAVVDGSGSASQAVLVDDLAQRVDEGQDFERAIAAVTTHDPRAGDFGLEILGSMIGIAVVEGLKAFFEAYMKELEEKAGKSLADMSVDWVKKQFIGDAKGPGRAKAKAQLAASVRHAAKARDVPEADLDAALASVDAENFPVE